LTGLKNYIEKQMACRSAAWNAATYAGERDWLHQEGQRFEILAHLLLLQRATNPREQQVRVEIDSRAPTSPTLH
jgi:hypothetical protein